MREQSIDCPKCGGVLNIQANESEDYVVCEYCESVVYIGDFRAKERKRREEEQNRENERKQKEEKAKIKEKKRFAVRIGVVFLLIGIVLIYISIMTKPITILLAFVVFLSGVFLICFNAESDSSGEDGKPVDISVPDWITSHKKVNYLDAEKMLKNAGFLFIKSIPVHDVVIGVFSRPGTVKSVTFNGVEKQKGEHALNTSQVVILYHSK